MEYFIYNNTNYTVSITDVHYVSNYEAGNGGSLGITAVFRIEPHSWNTTRRCDSQEVEKSIQVGMLRASREKGNIIICDRSEYEEKTREQAAGRMESTLGLSGQEKEAQQSFGFLNKAIKKSATPVMNINDFIIGEVDEEEDTLEEDITLPTQEVQRIAELEEQMSDVKGTLKEIVLLLQKGAQQKKVVKKAVKSKNSVSKKKNVQNRKRK